MADKNVYLPGTEASKAYDDALRSMLESLERRKEPLFDPTLLAIARGAGKPAAGGIGELFGNIAESLSGEQERARKEEEQIAGIKLDLASRGLGVEQQKQRERAFDKMMGVYPTDQGAGRGPTGGLPTTGGGTQEQTGALPAPAGFQGVQGIQVSEPNKGFADSRKYLGMARLDPTVSPAEAMKQAQEIESKRYQTKEGGVLDLATGMFYPFPKGELVERAIFGEGGGKTYKVDQRTAALLDLYAANNDPRYLDIASRVIGGPKISSDKREEPSGVPVSGKRPSMKSESEKRLDEEREKAEIAGQAKFTEKSVENIAKRMQIGNQISSATRDLDAIAKRSPRVFGLLKDEGLAARIAEAAEKGILGVKIPSETIAAYKLTKKEIDDLQLAVDAANRMQVFFRKLERDSGEGPTSDIETNMFASLAASPKESPAVVLAKNEMVRERAKFDKDLYKTWVDYRKKNKLPFEDFLASEEYNAVFGAYENRLNTIRQQHAAAFGFSPPANTPAPANKPTETPPATTTVTPGAGKRNAQDLSGWWKKLLEDKAKRDQKSQGN